MSKLSLQFILQHVIILAYQLFDFYGWKVSGDANSTLYNFESRSGSMENMLRGVNILQISHSSQTGADADLQAMKDFNNNTILLQSDGSFNHSQVFNNATVVLSKYQITEAEAHMQANLGNMDWFLDKMVLFGKAIANLTQYEDLAPGPVADTLFGGIVTLAREFPTFNPVKLMSHPLIQELKPKVVEKCGIAEYFLEVFHSKKVIRGEIQLKEFIYYENYRLLMKFEVKCIRQYMSSYQFDRIQKVVFIGSGPMPLSSIELIRYLPPTAFIVNYDHSEGAVELGAALVESQHLSHRISFVKCSALDIPDLKDADVVYLAALAGSTNVEKTVIIRHFYQIMKPGSLIVARSAIGLRTFLYQRLTAEDFGEFQDFQQFDPKDKVIINSVAMALKSSGNVELDLRPT